jgi:hypothetical protein
MNGAFGKNVYFTRIERDGNLVSYGQNGEMMWSAGWSSPPDSYLKVEDTGNVALYSRDNKRLGDLNSQSFPGRLYPGQSLLANASLKSPAYKYFSLVQQPGRGQHLPAPDNTPSSHTHSCVCMCVHVCVSVPD